MLFPTGFSPLHCLPRKTSGFSKRVTRKVSFLTELPVLQPFVLPAEWLRPAQKAKEDLHRNIQPWPDLFLLVFQGVFEAPVRPVGVCWVWAEGNLCPQRKIAQLAVLDPVKGNVGQVLFQFCFFCKGSIGYAKGMLSVSNKEAHGCGEWNNNK